MIKAMRCCLGGGCRVLCGLVLAGLVAVGPAGAGPKGSADLQWAQQVLKDKHFDPGRPNGEMTAKTHGALSAYQRAAGLPVTGELDPATTARLMGERGASPAAGTLGGTLNAPAHGHAQPVAQGPSAVHAAPTSRIETSGGQAMMPLAPAPRAVPAGTVTAMPTQALPGQVLNNRGDETVNDAPLVLMAAPWVRTLVLGVIVAVFGGFGALWWLSGRNPSWMRRQPLSGTAGASRVEPSFGMVAEEGRGTDAGLRARRPL